jgi:Domain of unknown function (DUF4129)
MRLRRSFAGSRGLALIGLVAVLLAVVAWAATGVRAGGADASQPANGRLNGALEAVAAAAWGAGVVVLIVTVRRLRRRLEEEAEAVDPEPPKPWWVSLIAWLIVAAVFIIPVVFLTDRRPQESEASPTAEATPGGSTLTSEDQRRPSPWLIVGFSVGAAAAALAFALRRGRPVVDAREPLPDLLANVVDVVDDSIRDIETEPDARRAIIRAYARMERALAQGGVPRRPSETPFEYLESTLRRLMVPAEPARSLTELFEVAKFSDRPIDASMKRRAIDCLLDVRSALTAEVT